MLLSVGFYGTLVISILLGFLVVSSGMLEIVYSCFCVVLAYIYSGFRDGDRISVKGKRRPKSCGF